MPIFRCFLILICVYLGVSSCISDESYRVWQEATAKAQIQSKEDQIREETARKKALAKEEAARKEYNRILDSASINDLTTCKHANLNKVRKNLIVMGYEIESFDNQVLVTKWHQYRSYSDGSIYYDKFSAVKVGSNQIKLKERRKSESPHTESDKQVNTIKDGSYEQRLENQRQACRIDPNSEKCQARVLRQDTTSETVSYRTTTRIEEFEPTYYARDYDFFKSYRDQICGSEPVKKGNNTKKKNSTTKK